MSDEELTSLCNFMTNNLTDEQHARWLDAYEEIIRLKIKVGEYPK